MTVAAKHPHVAALAGRVGDVEAGMPIGSVTGVLGHAVTLRGLRGRVGDAVTLLAADGERPGEIVSVDADGSQALVFGTTAGIGVGCGARLEPAGMTVTFSPELLGRVLDGLGQPIDGGPAVDGAALPVMEAAPHPLERVRIDTPLPVGVRVMDALTTVARGQRVGLFGGSGVGKSTLLGMLARGTTADVTVIALVGERGREVREFLEDDLGEEARKNTVVVVATSDQPPLVRTRAAHVATRIAEAFADGGKDVLLLFDSVTRFATAQREVGLAAGEPPTSRGYTPSVFTELASLLERTGPRANGTITGLYTVLVDGDDMDEPVADAARSILDGHVVLNRRLANAGRWPAVDPLASLSRLAAKVTDEATQDDAVTLRAALAAIEDVRDLVEVGAYAHGTNPVADRALAARDRIAAFLGQRASEVADFDQTRHQLAELAAVLRGGGS